MSQDNTNAQQRIWHDSAHASLCALGVYLRRMGFFRPLEQRVHLSQKVLKYNPDAKTGDILCGSPCRSQSCFAYSDHRACGPCPDRCLWAAWMCRAVGHRPDAECRPPSRMWPTCKQHWVRSLAAMVRHDDTLSNKSSRCSMWISHLCQQVSGQRSPNVDTWAVAVPRPGASWYGCERPIPRKPSGRR